MSRVNNTRRPMASPEPAAASAAAAPRPASTRPAAPPAEIPFTQARSAGAPTRAADSVREEGMAIRERRSSRAAASPGLALADLPSHVAAVASKLDLDGNKKLDGKDFPGSSQAEIDAVLTSVRIMGSTIAAARLKPEDIQGKRVLLTGLQALDKDKAEQTVRDLGGIPVKTLSSKVDVLVVGNGEKTTKDEKAFRMNAEGKANIRMVRESDFVKSFTKPDPVPGEANPKDATPAGLAAKHAAKYGAHSVPYEDAFRLAIPAVIHQEGGETPRDIIKGIAEMDGKPLTEAQLDKKMQKLVNAGNFELLPVGESNENGDDPKKFWIFRVHVETGSDHGFWASVDRDTGEVSVTGFN